MKDFVQRIFFKTVSFCSYHIGRIYAPYARKLITGSDLRAMLAVGIQDGDILVSRTNGELANVAIPGVMSHLGVIEGQTVYEASTTGVRNVDIIDFFINKDVIAVLRPNFMTPEQIALQMSYLKAQIGKPYNYDFKFSESDDKFYCTELGYKSIVFGNKESPFTLRRRLGVLTVSPDDFYKAQKKFIMVWKSKSL